MNSFDLDIDEMHKALRDLGALRHDLMRHREAARDLNESVPHSADPVALKMREVYQGRADSDTGVRGLLEDYIEEVDDMIALINATAQAYTAADQDAAARLRMPHGEDR